MELCYKITAGKSQSQTLSTPNGNPQSLYKGERLTLAKRTKYREDWPIYTGVLKVGTYAWVGQKFHNVKSIDPSALNHI
jgi:hypothetical protein